jgi:sugar/nucleoside kinase (ribokinase family)
LATLIAGILKSEKPENILKNACAMGTFVAGHRGANPDYDLKTIGEISEQHV